MNTLTKDILIQLAILLINFYFTALEVAIGEVSETTLKAYAEAGEEKANRLIAITEDPSGIARSLKIGTDLAGYLGAAIAVFSFTKYLASPLSKALPFLSGTAVSAISMVIIVLVFTLVTAVFGKLLPRRIAQQKPYGILKHSVGLIGLLSALFAPALLLTDSLTALILRILHLRTNIDDDVTEDDIRQMVDAGEETGTIESDEKEMIQNIFEFNDIAVDDIMTRAADVIYINIDANEDEILMLIKKTGKSRFPVIKNDDLNEVVGILNAKDFLLNYRESGGRKLSEMLRPAYFVPESIKADQLFSDMQKKKVHIAIVIDEYGETCGIVTLEDLLEEIVGNIYDEFDEAEAPEIEKIGDNRWKCLGSLPIDELEKELDIEIDTNGDFDTVGGMVYSCLHTIPEDGQTFTVNTKGLKIDVTKVQDKKIVETIIEKLENDDGEESDE
ncbi:MAG: HlyC/CorC family transporter [Spirochaetales bacterium]|nr:HlyC/CorC family transporter [Spirochaetales bacterium]